MMQMRALMFAAALTGLICATHPLLAASNANGGNAAAATTSQTNASNNQPTQTADTQQRQSVISQIVGNISIAKIALVYGMDNDALSHIDMARRNISELNSETSSLNPAPPLTAGKLSYKTFSGTSDYWVPIFSDQFAVRTLGDKHINSKNPEIDITDAQIVHYTVTLDTASADADLVKAQNAINQKQDDVAINALQDIANSTVREMTVADNPLEAARDNLILAKELLRDKNYRGSSFALKHADQELVQAEAADPSNSEIKSMQADVHKLQASVAQQNPSVLGKAERKMATWISDIKKWVHS